MSALQQMTKSSCVLLLKHSTLITFLAHLCVSDTKSHRSYLFATKTAYDNAFTAEERTARQSVWTHTVTEGKGCQPVQVNMVVRHGTRHPSEADTNNALSLMERIRGKISNPDLQNINEWEVPFQQFEPRSLSPVGVHELYNMGKRIGSNLLFMNLPSDLLLFQSSSRSRAVNSAAAFKRGFLRGKHKGQQPTEVRDDLMRYYDDCPKHIHEVVGSKEALREFHRFKKSPQMKGVSERMEQRLALVDEHLDYSIVFCVSW